MCSASLIKRRLRVALGKRVVGFREHLEQAGGGAGMVVDDEDAARAARKRLGERAVVGNAHLLAGRGPHDHFVVEHLETREVLDAGHERDVVDGLGQEVVGAAFEPLDLVGRLIERGDHDDGNVMGLDIGLDAAADFEAVHAGHHHVEQDDIDAFTRENVERLAAAEG